VGAARSAVGRGQKDGALAGVHPVELSAAVMRATVARAGVDPAQIDDVIWGCAMPEAGQGLNIARLASLRAGFPVEVSGMTVNRFCSSGLQTIALGAQAILSGMNDVVLAGGVEMMSAVPMSGFTTRLHPDLVEENIGMGFTAELVAKRWGITREAQDAFALASQQKAAAAQAAGRFRQEIVPISVEQVRWRGAEQSVTTSKFETDELVRGKTTLEGLAKLPPAFKPGGTVTAGNASPLSDGAAAVVLMSRARAEAAGLTPLARFVTFATAGVAPDVMGIGPVAAVPKALARAGLQLDQLKRIELN
ncbi:MAG: thiolase family protein, partial [Gemmatimonadota bacterium]